MYTTTFSIYTQYAWLKVINELERFVRHMFLLLHASWLITDRLCPEVVVMSVTAATRWWKVIWVTNMHDCVTFVCISRITDSSSLRGL